MANIKDWEMMYTMKIDLERIGKQIDLGTIYKIKLASKPRSHIKAGLIFRMFMIFFESDVHYEIVPVFI